MPLFRITWVNKMGQEESYQAASEQDRDNKINELIDDGLDGQWETLES